MFPIVISVFKVFLIVVPAILGVRLLFLDSESAQHLTGYRIRLRHLQQYQWVQRAGAILLIVFSLLCAWKFLI